MGRSRTPLQFISIDFLVGNFLVIGIGHSVPFSTQVKERV
jgi:hypothetical protein